MSSRIVFVLNKKANNSFQRTTISVIFFAKQKNRPLWHPVKLALAKKAMCLNDEY